MRKMAISAGMIMDGIAVFLALYISALAKFRWGMFPVAL